MASKTVLIDTNICLDAALSRKPFANDALKLIERAQKEDFAGKIAAHTFDTIFYLLQTNFRKNQIYELLNELRKVFDVADVTQSVIDDSLELKWPDFEDAIHYQAAKAASCEAIISRNQKDFRQSDLPVLSPDEFLEEIEW